MKNLKILMAFLVALVLVLQWGCLSDSDVGNGTKVNTSSSETDWIAAKKCDEQRAYGLRLLRRRCYNAAEAEEKLKLTGRLAKLT